MCSLLGLNFPKIRALPPLLSLRAALDDDAKR
jgi:hypothetical protein